MYIPDDLIYQNIFNNMTVGTVFANYPQLSKACGFPRSTGTTRIKQQQRLRSFIEWEKIGDQYELVITKMPEYPNSLYKSNRFNEAELAAHVLSYFLVYENPWIDGSCCVYKRALYDLCGLHFCSSSALTGETRKSFLQKHDQNMSEKFIKYVINVIKNEQRQLIDNGLQCLVNRKLLTMKPCYITYDNNNFWEYDKDDKEQETGIHEPRLLTKIEQQKVRRNSRSLIANNKKGVNNKRLFSSGYLDYMEHFASLNKLFAERNDPFRVYPCTRFKHINKRRIFSLYPEIKSELKDKELERTCIRYLEKLRKQLNTTARQFVKAKVKKQYEQLGNRYEIPDDYEDKIDFLMHHLLKVQTVEVVYRKHKKYRRDVFFLKSGDPDQVEIDLDDIENTEDFFQDYEIDETGF